MAPKKAPAAAKASAAAKAISKKAATSKNSAEAKTTAATTKSAATKKTAVPKKAAPVAKTSKKRKAPADDDDGDEVSKEDTKASKGKTPANKKVKSAPTESKVKAIPPKTAAKGAKSKATPAATASDEEDKENGHAGVATVNGTHKRARDTASAEQSSRPAKKARTATPSEKAVAPKKEPVIKKAPVFKFGPKINSPPTSLLDVYVFGEGSSGELGLGADKTDGKKPIDVKRPRLNPILAAANVVQIAAGGMHAAALTQDNRVLTWGVNDQGALGRDTNWDGGLRDMDAEDSDSDSDSGEYSSGLNPKESTPGEIDMTNVAPGTKFVSVVACDSATFILTEDGRVYGFGTFRASDGILGFTKDVNTQTKPVLLAEPKGVTQIVAGSNHVMTLNNKGKVETWGAAEQMQLGRRVVQRDVKASSLRPGGLAFKRGVRIVKLACGSYHSFAVDDKGQVYAWGLNNFGELGLENSAGDDDAVVLEPTHVTAFGNHKVVSITGGEHHSLAAAETGELLTWGRIDGCQTGLPLDGFTEDTAIFDARGKARILKEPTVVPGIPPVVSVAAGTDTSFAVTKDGQAYSWGFTSNYQTGLGASDDDIETPTLIDNSAVAGKKIVYAGAGGQFGMLASLKTTA